MSATLPAVLTGAIAMASAIAALFFLRFWRQTRDSFFLLFAVAFAIDAVSRVVSYLVVANVDEKLEPLLYVSRLVMFAIIIYAIVRKNWPRSG
jgi:hypothetical protein